MLTVPASTASAERSFSKLKLIKAYLRSTTSQERLSALSVLSIEAEIAASVSYDIILKKCNEHFFVDQLLDGIVFCLVRRLSHDRGMGRVEWFVLVVQRSSGI
ncbi:hypothetical protein TNCV_4940891 [Trichonephila clavipes]|nr:hypothetical protein TNCV_4940891 [Trichonephila clavipes]